MSCRLSLQLAVDRESQLSIHEGIASSPLGMSFRYISPPEDMKGTPIGSGCRPKYEYIYSNLKHAGQTMSLNAMRYLGGAFKENFKKANHSRETATTKSI